MTQIVCVDVCRYRIDEGGVEREAGRYFLGGLSVCLCVCVCVAELNGGQVAAAPRRSELSVWPPACVYVCVYDNN